MLGRSIARVSRSSKPYVCLACQSKQRALYLQTLPYSTAVESHHDNGGLHISVVSAEIPPPAQANPKHSESAKNATEAKKGGRRRRKGNDSKTTEAVKSGEGGNIETNKSKKQQNLSLDSVDHQDASSSGPARTSSPNSKGKKKTAKGEAKQAVSSKPRDQREAIEPQESSDRIRNLESTPKRKHIINAPVVRKFPSTSRREGVPMVLPDGSLLVTEQLGSLSFPKPPTDTVVPRPKVRKWATDTIVPQPKVRKPAQHQRKPTIRIRARTQATPVLPRLRIRGLRTPMLPGSLKYGGTVPGNMLNVSSLGKDGEPLENASIENYVTGVLSQILADDAATPKSIQDTAGFSSLEQALSGSGGSRRGRMDIKRLSADDLSFNPVDVEIPPVPTLSHGLDRVLFNPGVYHLQDPRSRVYNFDPYLEKIMPATEFDFDALGKYETSSKDKGLINMAKSLDAKFTGSTSSMSGVLTHFHYLLSQWRRLNLKMLSKEFPDSSDKFSKIQRGPSAIFLRWKDGTYAIDADKEYDTPNIMSFLGQSMEKLLTNSVDNFERYRRSSAEKTPEDEDSKCFHYTQQGNVLMRSQLDAKDPRLPGTGIFDLKTRAVVPVRMEAKEFEQHKGYQIRNLRGEWESFEREYYDMTRATMLKYSLQVRMGRMDGIFIAFHNIERIFGFQYVSKSEMDLALHGQEDTCLGDQEFKLSIELLSEILDKATKKFPEQSIRLHFETRDVEVPFMYIFAEPVTEEQVEVIQNKNQAQAREFERTVVGIQNEEEEKIQKEWGNISERLEAELEEDQEGKGGAEYDEGVVTQQGNIVIGEDGLVEDIEQESMTDDVAEPVEEAETDLPADSEAIIESLEQSLSESTANNILGMTLTIRNRVNGTYVPRPEILTANDSWDIEYSLSEIPSKASAARLYSAVKDRRQKLLVFEPLEDGTVDGYREMLRMFSKRGRLWRNDMDKNDRKREAKVYTPIGMDREAVVAKMGPWGRRDEGKKDSGLSEKKLDARFDGAEDYMEWLYGNMGKGKDVKS